MDAATYAAVRRAVTLPISATPNFRSIARACGVTVDTVYSIYSQEVQGAATRRHHALVAAAPALAARYLAGADVLSLAFEVDLPPCLVLRRLLEALPLDLPGARGVTDVLRHPAALARLVSPARAAALAAPPADGAAFLARLQADVEAAVECDGVYSPASDAARRAAGLAHEARLYAALAAAGVAFRSEEQLRAEGYTKTPDAKLAVPVAVRGRVVCWVDSKATFGDERTHRAAEREQYARYVNRFGPGLVIYWHGYLAALAGDGGEDDDDDGDDGDDGNYGGGNAVLLADSFPAAEEIMRLPCLPLRLGADGGGENGWGAGDVGGLGGGDGHASRAEAPG